MIKVLKFILLITLLLPSNNTSQILRPENKAIVAFIPKVTRVNRDKFLYSYTVISSPESKEIFDHFALSISDNLLAENISEFNEPTNKKWLVSGHPHGFVTGTAANRFVGIPPSDGLAPGDSMTFSFQSKGLPSIKVFYAQSYAEPYTSDELDSLYAIGYTDAQLFPDWKENSYKGYTIAPHVFDSPFVPLAFLDTLISYKHQAFALGWIKNQGIVQSLDAKLENAKRQLLRNNRTAAKNMLQAFVNEVEALWKEESPPYGGRQISSEAYALLKFNAEYLISKL